MKKGRVINLEWMCDYNHYTAEDFELIKTKLIFKEILQAATDGCNVIIGIYLLDGFLQPKARHKEFISHLNEIKDYAKQLGIDEVYLVSGQGEHIDDCPFKYFFFDYNVRMVFNSYKDLNALPHYNPKNEKFLFLTGMPDRPNRIGLLSKYYDAGLLNFSEWTFFAPWTAVDKTWCREHLSRYNDQEYETFLKDCERSFDNRYETAKPFYGSYTSGNADVVWHDVVDTDWVQAPAHIDSSVYANTLFSVISEGPNYWHNDNDFATEKSWRTFLHRHPFIFAGHPDQFRYLKTLGYKTFEEYLPIKDYAYIEDEDTRLTAVVENTKYLLAHREHDDAIRADTEHNYNVFFKHVEAQHNLYKHFKDNLGIPQSDIDYYFDKIGYTQLIRRIPND